MKYFGFNKLFTIVITILLLTVFWQPALAANNENSNNFSLNNSSSRVQRQNESQTSDGLIKENSTFQMGDLVKGLGNNLKSSGNLVDDGPAVPIFFGETKTGNISKPGEKGNYSFNANAGDVIFSRMSSSWSSDPNLKLFAPDGTQLISKSGYEYVEFNTTLQITGNYILQAGVLQGDSTGNYGVFLQRTNNPGNATPFSFGSTLTGNISLKGEYQSYSFSGNSGDVIFSRMSSSWSSDPNIKIYSPDGSQLISKSGYENVELNITLPSNGTYTLLAGDLNGLNTGSYGVFLQRPNNPGNATPFLFGSTHSGDITHYGEYQSYSFSGNSGDAIFSRMSSTWSSDPNIKIYSPDGSQLISKSGYENVELNITLPSNGTYTLLAGDLNGLNTGSYGVFLQRPNNPGNATPFLFGSTHSGDITHYGEYQSYSFSGNSGDAIFSRMSSTWSSDPNIKIYSPDGSQLISKSGYENVELNITLPSNGTYTLLAGDLNGLNSGSYGVFLQRVNNPGNATPFSFGSTLTGNISFNGEYQSYSFSGKSGDIIYSRMSSTWRSDPNMKLYSPDGIQLISRSGYDYVEFNITLPSNGTYTLLAGDLNGLNSGSYGVFLQRVNNPGNATPFSFGSTLKGNISFNGEYQSYSFSGNSGDIIYSRMSSTWRSDPNMKLYSPDGIQLISRSGYDYVEFNITLPSNGTYTLLAGDLNGLNSGSYGVFLQRVNNPGNATPFSFGSTLTGNISFNGEYQSYSFSGNSGDIIYSRMSSTWRSDPNMKLYSPDGIQLISRSGYDYVEFNITLPSNGTYTLLAGDLNGLNSGSYGVFLQRPNNPGNSTLLIPGSSIGGNIVNLSQYDTYSIPLQVSNMLKVSMKSGWSSYPSLKFFNIDGNLQKNASGYSECSLTTNISKAGNYTLLAGDLDGNSIGTYSINTKLYNATPLNIGQTLNGVVSANGWTYYRVNVTSGMNLAIILTPNTTDTYELYSGFDYFPDESHYDIKQASKTLKGTYELLISPTQTGSYYLGVHSLNSAETTYTISASSGKSYLSDIYPRVLTNTSDTTLMIYGLGFTTGMQVILTSDSSVNVSAKQVFIGSPTTLISTFDLSRAVLGVYDLKALWPDGTVYYLNDSVTVNKLPEGVIYQDTNITVTPGITKKIPLYLSEDHQNLFVTLNKFKGSSEMQYTWNGLLRVLYEGNELKSDKDSQDQIVQIQNSSKGNYTFEISSPEKGAAIFTVYDSLPNLPKSEWTVEKILRPYGSVFNQFTVPTGQKVLQLDAQAIGSWSNFRVYRDHWGSNNTWIGSSGPYANLKISDPAAGLYILSFQDTQMVTGEDQSRDVMIRASLTSGKGIETNNSPVITSFTPQKGGISGNVTITIEGGWLLAGSNVILSGSSGNTIKASPVTHSADNRTISAVFDLNGKSPGSYDVVVTNQDGSKAIGPAKFSIESGGKGEFFSELSGREKIRYGYPATFVITYGNKGSVDMPAQVVGLAKNPQNTGVSARFLPDGVWKTLDQPLTFICGDIGGDPSVLPAGSKYTKEISVRADLWDKFSLFLIPFGTRDVYSPTTLESVTDILVPGPGMPLSFGRSYGAGPLMYNGPFGYGWVHSYDIRLEWFDDGNIGLKRGDSYADMLARQSDGSYVSLYGYPSLRFNSDGSSVLTGKDGSYSTFGTDLLLKTLVDTAGNTLTLEYQDSHLIGVLHSDGDRITVNYDRKGKISSLIDPFGKETTFNYSDSLLTLVTSPKGTTSYEYSENNGGNLLSKIVYPGGIEAHFEADSAGRISKIATNGGREMVSFGYDTDSHETATNDATGSSFTVTVNDDGNIIRMTDQIPSTASFSYTGMYDMTGYTDPNGRLFSTTYDDAHNPVTFTDAAGSLTRIAYDSRFHLPSQVTDARGNSIGITYDGKGNMRNLTYPDGSRESRDYNEEGLPTSITTRSGDKIQCEYDFRGQLIKLSYPDGTVYSYQYNAGNLVSATGPGGIISLGYDTADRLTHITYPDGKGITYSYNVAGQVTRKALSDGVITGYGYDSIGNLISVTDESGTMKASYSYDAAGRLLQTLIDSGAYTIYRYDTAGRLTSLVNSGPDGSVISQFLYQYDKNGNPVQVTTKEGVTRYSYDALNQLTNVTYPDGFTISYLFDSVGNRVSVTENGLPTPYAINQMNQYTSVGGMTFNFDANGNVISKIERGNTTTYEYRADNRIKKVISPEGTWEYSYDPLGNRNKVVHNGVTESYLIDPIGLGNIVAISSGNQTTHYRYGYGLLSLINQSGIEYSYLFDLTGHTNQIIDKTGKIVNEYSYKPFGEYRKKTERIDNPFIYVGQYGVMDDENGLYYMRMREYDPIIGRFVSEDLIITDLLSINDIYYKYCWNTPIRFIDPDGLSGIDPSERMRRHVADYWKAFLPSFTGLLIGLGIDVITDYAYEKYPIIGRFIPFIPPEIGSLPETIDRAKRMPIIGISGDIIGDATGDVECRLFGNCDPNRHIKPQHKDPQGSHLPITPVGPVDPEDKYGPPGYDHPNTSSLKRFIPGATQTLPYRVDIWNAENATANVRDIYVYDEIDKNLNRSSFGFTEAGFINWTVSLDGADSFLVYVDPRPAIDLIVKIQGMYNEETGMVNLSYQSLDPVTLKPPEDDTKGFLPPITQSGKEITWFAYTAENKPDLPTGTEIRNRAWVNFDGVGPYNPAPPNGSYVNTIDSSKPVSNLSATLNGTTINVHLSGSDTGSGITGYTVFASVDNGDYYPALSDITGSSASFPGSKGHTYRLYSQATDNVGNTEDPHASPDATVVIPDINSPVLTRLSPEFAAVGSPAVNLTTYGSEFTGSGVIRADGNPISTSYVSGTELRGVIPSGYMTSQRSIVINVKNTDTGLVSNSLPFKVVSNKTWIINATSSPNGTISPSGLVNVPDGGDQKFSMTPDTGFRVSDVQVDGGSVGPVSSYTFHNVSANHTIYGQFSKISGQHVINATADDWTINYPPGTRTYPEGSNKTYITESKPGADLTDVKVDNSSKGSVPSYTFTNISSGHDILTEGTPSPGQIHVYINATPASGRIPLSVRFKDQSLGDPTSWYWQFGDGLNSSEQNPVHIYYSTGTYSITLKAYNNLTSGIGVCNDCVKVID